MIKPARYRFALIALTLACAIPALAEDFTAINPLPAPFYSFDRNSPTIIATPLDAGDVLRHPGPVVFIDRANLGLNSINDELDGLSFGNAGFSTMTEFVIRFSVDRASMGAVPPDPGLVALGFPFNVQDQAGLNQQAADEFISLRRFTRMGIQPLVGTGVSNNNTQTRNQGDAGGIDFSASPDTSPTEPNGGAQDDVKSGAAETGALVGTGPPPPLFFTARRLSPSLLTLPGTGSGADIFVDFNTGAPGGQNLYVSAAMLGLQPNDDIDALLIFESGDGKFNRNRDQILFSLARGSPSLEGMGSPAAIFTTTPGGLNVFASAADLGLAETDNIDMLEQVPCDDVLFCVSEFGIGNKPPIVPAAQPWGVVLLCVVLAFVGSVLLRRRMVRTA